MASSLQEFLTTHYFQLRWEVCYNTQTAREISTVQIDPLDAQICARISL